METYGFGLYVFRRDKLQIRTEMQSTTHVTKSPKFHRDKSVQGWAKRGRRTSRIWQDWTDNWNLNLGAKNKHHTTQKRSAIGEHWTLFPI